MKKKKKTITRRIAGTTKRKAVLKKKVVKKSKKTHAAPKTKTVIKRVHKSGGDKVTTSTSPMVHLDEKVPFFTIHATNGVDIESSSLIGKNIVLYFYPKDSTPGCTREGHEFTKLYSEFAKHNTEVFGISKDSLSSHEKFKSKEGYCFDLISDESGVISNLFGVWKEKQNYGRKYFGIERSTFIIDAQGVLRKEWRGVKVDGHAQEVLNAIKEINN